VTFSLDGASSGCSLDGATVTFTGAGTCVIDANQAGNTDYEVAAQVQQSVSVGRAAQTIGFTSTAPIDAGLGGTYTVTATGGGSRNPVTFSLAGSSSGCTLDGATVTFTGAGACAIDADQSGDTNHTAAAQVRQSVSVSQAVQAVTFTSHLPTNPMG
jgi:hypothetical protein